MPLAELPDRENVYPLDVAELVANSFESGWPDEPILCSGESKIDRRPMLTATIYRPWFIV